MYHILICICVHINIYVHISHTNKYIFRNFLHTKSANVTILYGSVCYVCVGAFRSQKTASDGSPELDRQGPVS